MSMQATLAAPAGDGLAALDVEALRALFRHMRNGMAYCRMLFEDGQPQDFMYLATNPAFESQTGLRHVTGRWVSEVIPGIRSADPHLFEVYGRVARGGPPESFETYVQALQMWFAISVYSPRQDHFVAVFDVITERKETEERLRMMATVFSNGNEAIVITDADNHIVTVNAAFSRLTGYLPEDVIGQDPKILSAGMTPPEVYEEMWSSIAATDAWQGELVDRRKSGEIYPKWLSISAVRDEAGSVRYYIGNFIDIAERKASENRVRFLAHHDPLTGLPNRFSLQEQLEQMLALAKRHAKQLALMLIDLDYFKDINDTLGHQAGDRLLIEVGTRLRRSVRDSDLVARLGGDEFVVVMPEVDSLPAAATVATKILRTLGEPCMIQGVEQRPSPSIGICFYPGDAVESQDLLKKADVAMYHAKSQGRGRYQFFTPEMQAAAIRRVALEADLRVGLERGQFLLHYQPQLDLRSGRIVGVEALIRWNHPRRGLVAPGEFIPVAEEIGLIAPLGDWVLREACRELSGWKSRGIGPLRMSVNLSASQFMDPELPARIETILREAGLSADCLDLEVTESTSMKSPADTVAVMRALTERGLSLSIDDFGTGYSSLAYLKSFPIQTLKIDRSFVKDIEIDTNDADICDVTVLLAHRLGLEVVAEGVETEAQLKYLLSIGCEKVQGYLVSKPLPGEQAEEFLRNSAPLTGLGTIDLWLSK